jgi:hypothetical protein
MLGPAVAAVTTLYLLRSIAARQLKSIALNSRIVLYFAICLPHQAESFQPARDYFVALPSASRYEHPRLSLP